MTLTEYRQQRTDEEYLKHELRERFSTGGGAPLPPIPKAQRRILTHEEFTKWMDSQKTLHELMEREALGLPKQEVAFRGRLF